MTGVIVFVESVVSLGVEGSIGRRRRSQNNFTDEFQAKISPDETVLNRSKIWHQREPCALFGSGYIFFIVRNIYHYDFRCLWQF